MAESNYAICYEPIQRIYRNAVVTAARRALKEAFADDSGERVKAVFKKTWQQLVEDAEERRDTGELGTTLTDELDYLGVSQFQNLFEAFFDILFPPAPGATDRSRQQERQAILSWAKEIRVFRDPQSHPSEVDLPYEDAFRVLDAARRILLKIDSEAASRVQEYVAQLRGAPIGEEPRPPLEGYLPPADSIAVDFVGRRRELEALHSWFGDPRKRRWALMGDGGKGKTATAYQFACEVREKAKKPYEFVIWLSAKRRLFVEGAVVEIPRPDFADLESALRWILAHYGWGGAEDLRVERCRDLCIDLLREFPALIVVDDVDSLEGVAESAIEFFTLDVPTTASKVLLTSRRKLMGFGATTTIVEGFDEAEGLQFVDSRIRLFGLDQEAFPPGLAKKVLDVTDGSPLFIEDLLRLCATGVPVRDAVKVWGERSGDEARRYALGRELSLLSPNGQQALVACTVADDPVSLAEIQAVTGMSDDTARSAVEELQRLFLVPRPRLIEEVERFDLNLNTRRLVRARTADTDLYRRVEAGFRALAGDLLSSPQRRLKIGGYIRQAVGLVKQDRHAEAEKTLQAGLAEYPNDPDLMGQLGWVYKAWKPQPRLSEAREMFERARQLRCKKEEMYTHWSDMEALQREWTKSAEAAEAGLEVRPASFRLKCAAGYARSRLGQDLLRELQPRAGEELMRARSHYKEGLRAPEDLVAYRDRQVQSRIYRGLVVTLHMLVGFTGDEDESDIKRRQEFAREALELLQLWTREHPDDLNAATEVVRLEPKLNAVLA